MYATKMTVTITTDLPVEHRGNARTINAGETVTVTCADTNLWVVEGYRRLGSNTYVTASALHKHTAHALDIGTDCDSCDGSGKRTSRFESTSTPCKTCKTRGYVGRTYKANV